MYVANEVHGDIENVRNIKLKEQSTILVMETSIEHPGFTRLRFIAIGETEIVFVTNTGKDLYFSVNVFLDTVKSILGNFNLSQHGPCLSDPNQTFDLAFCLRSKYIPNNVIPWAMRHRKQWPPNFVIDKIKNSGCLLVPIGPKIGSGCNLLWRISFSVAEKLLVHSFNFTQLLCYGLLKLTLKRIVNTNENVKDLLCSYFLKTALFWVSEEVNLEMFQLPKLYICFSLCLDKLLLWVNSCYCPNFFIPEHNMFLGKIDQSNNKILLSVIKSIKYGGIGGLMTNLVSADNGNHRLLRIKDETSFIMLDFLFYRICGSYMAPIYSRFYEVLAFIESLLMYEQSACIIGVCNHYKARINQFAAQIRPLPTTVNKEYYMHKRYHRHLQDGTMTDAVSGWLLYASYYYVTGQHKVTLELTDYILSRCTPDMIPIGCNEYDECDAYYYRKNVHSTLTLIERMKMAAEESVCYMQHSSLIPGELQLEVQDRDIDIPVIVMSHSLRFLCYHHFGDRSNKKQALRDLHLTLEDQHNILPGKLSESFTILGVCYEISGDRDKAFQLYDKALQCVVCVCVTAEKRKSKLLEI
ncbi:uncharacterized protein LOC127721112 [Mytilus californianus]|uniref:uncharacterized protein LOC127721112 n=1 Tax=Mytilus californianus TaxID=6549 RepID=UPI0022466044|nr:uncharacterized protein LOC127721112 [Mytilus californianus]